MGGELLLALGWTPSGPGLPVPWLGGMFAAEIRVGEGLSLLLLYEAPGPACLCSLVVNDSAGIGGTFGVRSGPCLCSLPDCCAPAGAGAGGGYSVMTLFWVAVPFENETGERVRDGPAAVVDPSPFLFSPPVIAPGIGV